NWSVAVSAAAEPPNHLTSKFLKKDRSQLLIPGRRTSLRGAFPKVPRAGTWKAAVLNHSLTDCWPLGRLGFPTRLARWHSYPGVPVPAISRSRQTVAGSPERKVPIPTNSHPPRTALV